MIGRARNSRGRANSQSTAIMHRGRPLPVDSVKSIERTSS